MSKRPILTAILFETITASAAPAQLLGGGLGSLPGPVGGVIGGVGNTVDMVKYIVPILEGEGFTFKAIDEDPEIAAVLPKCDPGCPAACTGPGPEECTTCEAGTYAAYRHLLDEDVDLVLHLGDYIYEFAGDPDGSGRTTYPDHGLATVADYRLRYASYKLDADLRAAHERFPFALTWDDHEVANNYAGDTMPSGACAKAQMAIQ